MTEEKHDRLTTNFGAPVPDAAQREALVANTGRAMADSSEEVKVRRIATCLKADRAYGEGVAAVVGIPMSKVGS